MLRALGAMTLAVLMLATACPGMAAPAAVTCPRLAVAPTLDGTVGDAEWSGAAALGPFEELTEMPADQVGGPNAEKLLHLIYQQHLPLKRWMWRAGLVAAAEGGSLEEIRWPE